VIWQAIARSVLLRGRVCIGFEFESIPIEKDEGISAILGHAGFIKTVEDLYEAMACSVPGVKFGIAFAEASGPCLVRSEGNDESLRTQAEKSILYPINVIADVRSVNEVAAVYCATSNPVKVVVANIEDDRSVVGIIDGSSSRAVEGKDDKQSRSRLLRDLGYKK